MSYTLIHSDQYFVDILGWAWPKILNMAEAYGWKPAGTLAPDRPDFDPPFIWEGGYLSNDLQIVTTEDAAALAAALEAALDDIPDHQTMPTRILQTLTGPREVVALPEGQEIAGQNFFEALGGRGKLVVRAVITLCRRGSFVIA